MAIVASDVRISILGPLEVRVGFGDPVDVVGPRLRRLLVRLALDPDRVVLTGQLVDSVWGEDPPAGVTNALQSLVSRLRRLLPDTVESHPAGYRLALEPDAVDIVRFKSLALAGHEELRSDPRQAGATLREALALWRGPALADAADAHFAQAAAARLDELRLGALEDRIEADLATTADGALVAELEELVTAHPLRERLCGQLMRALTRSGRQAEALAAYQRLRTRLADELGIDPSEELKAVHLDVLRGELAPPRRPAPPTAGPVPAATRTNLRAQITSFVGRDGDIARIASVFADARPVTLVGPGGCGKTRLAAEAAARMLERMPDGVWMVELGSVVDGADLPQALLSLLGARELGLLPRRGASAVPPRERLVEAVGDKHLLLVMDNCEHVLAAGAALVDWLLARCPALRVLATSREPLGIIGEVLHPVLPLALPDAQATPAEALRYPAVRLFADRGAAVRPGFGVDQTNLEWVRQICVALDGIPLAIELAAARLRALSPRQIAARLDDRFRLLAGGGRPVLPRHQTLRAVVDWSWNLLGDSERILLRRLAVFSGGATLEAVEQVCAGPGLPGLDADEVLYLLAALVDKSLASAESETTEGTGGLKSVAPGGHQAASQSRAVAPRWIGWITRPPRSATRCSRRSGPTARSGACRLARTRRCGGRTPSTSSVWPRRPTGACAAPASSGGWSGCRARATTCTRRCAGRSTAGTPRWRCAWSPRSAGTGCCAALAPRPWSGRPRRWRCRVRRPLWPARARWSSTPSSASAEARNSPMRWHPSTVPWRSSMGFPAARHACCTPCSRCCPRWRRSSATTTPPPSSMRARCATTPIPGRARWRTPPVAGC
jgi:predicted ATPase/DNA-binding SARP family transcriptional activator